MTYNHTIRSCFTGYIVQAVVNNFVPLLFLTFRSELGLSLSQVTSLITVNFSVQLLTDLAAAKYIDKIGYRAGMVLAHFLAAAGFICLAFLPYILPSAYAGILISVVMYAIGGGLLEVLVSPVVEACPTDHKEKTMSMLHSFYCWGQMGVVFISTVFFKTYGIENWRIMALIWACIPLVNGIIFTRVPIAPLLSEDEETIPVYGLLKSRIFWILLMLMLCAGACELAVSQWSSAFAEQGLGVSKAVGDIAGPMFFAVLMGLARLLYGKFGDRINLVKFMTFSICLCIAAYLVTALSPIPAISLMGCGICGFSVGILWPGVFSLGAASLKSGGTGMFALLALAGDLGCNAGPTLVGFVSDIFGGELSIGILSAVIFPVMFIAVLMLYRREARTASKGTQTQNVKAT